MKNQNRIRKTAYLASKHKQTIIYLMSVRQPYEQVFQSCQALDHNSTGFLVKVQESEAATGCLPSVVPRLLIASLC